MKTFKEVLVLVGVVTIIIIALSFGGANFK